MKRTLSKLFGWLVKWRWCRNALYDFLGTHAGQPILDQILDRFQSDWMQRLSDPDYLAQISASKEMMEAILNSASNERVAANFAKRLAEDRNFAKEVSSGRPLLAMINSPMLASAFIQRVEHPNLLSALKNRVESDVGLAWSIASDRFLDNLSETSRFDQLAGSKLDRPAVRNSIRAKLSEDYAFAQKVMSKPALAMVAESDNFVDTVSENLNGDNLCEVVSHKLHHDKSFRERVVEAEVLKQLVLTPPYKAVLRASLERGDIAALISERLIASDVTREALLTNDVYTSARLDDEFLSTARAVIGEPSVVRSIKSKIDTDEDYAAELFSSSALEVVSGKPIFLEFLAPRLTRKDIAALISERLIASDVTREALLTNDVYTSARLDDGFLSTARAVIGEPSVVRSIKSKIDTDEDYAAELFSSSALEAVSGKPIFLEFLAPRLTRKDIAALISERLIASDVTREALLTNDVYTSARLDDGFLSTARAVIGEPSVVRSIKSKIDADEDYAVELFSSSALEALSGKPVFMKFLSSRLTRNDIAALISERLIASDATRNALLTADVYREAAKDDFNFIEAARQIVGYPAVINTIRSRASSDAKYAARIFSADVLSALPESDEFTRVVAKTLDADLVTRAVRRRLVEEASYRDKVIASDVLAALGDAPGFRHEAVKHLTHPVMRKATRSLLLEDQAFQKGVLDVEVIAAVSEQSAFYHVVRQTLASSSMIQIVKERLKNDVEFRDKLVDVELLQDLASGPVFEVSLQAEAIRGAILSKIAADPDWFDLSYEPTDFADDLDRNDPTRKLLQQPSLVAGVIDLLGADSEYRAAVLTNTVMLKAMNLPSVISIAAGMVRSDAVKASIRRIMLADPAYAKELITDEVLRSLPDGADSHRLEIDGFTPDMVEMVKSRLERDESFTKKVLTNRVIKAISNQSALCDAGHILLRSPTFKKALQTAVEREPALAASLAGNAKFFTGLLSKPWKGKRKILEFSAKTEIIQQKLEGFYGRDTFARMFASQGEAVTDFKHENEVRDYVLSRLCAGNTLRLPHAEIEFIDKKSLWTLFHEILIHEEYYFRSTSSTPLIIDCGANFGMSIAYWKWLYPEARVKAFEPIPEFAELVKANMARNELKNVEVVNAALSRKAGTEAFFVSENHSMAGSLTDRRVSFGDKLREIQVETVCLSDHITEEVAFLKLDIEGAEPMVLKEIASKLELVNQMTIEWHTDPNDPSGGLTEALNLLERAGFACSVGKSHNYGHATEHRPITYTSAVGTYNIWAVKRSLVERFSKSV